ncbi:MAG: heme exporter protein CcmB, partial [Geminicoccaceae bacterium]
MQALTALLRRDLALASRRLADSFMGLAFFALALSLFPFGVGASPDILARIGAGVVWVVALLAVLLTLDRLWLADHEDGSLELLLLAPVPLELLVVVKCLAHWLTSG